MAVNQAKKPISAPSSVPLNHSFADTRIYFVRGERVMLDSDLAEVYGVDTRNLNKAVDRNADRFPEEFAFRLTDDEWKNLMFQIGTSSLWGGRRKLPRVFTEHGTVMVASVLNSPFAVKASLQVVRAFVHLRRVLDANRELARRIDGLNARLEKKTGDDNLRFQSIFQELKRLALGYDAEEAKPKGRIGYRTNAERGMDNGKQQGQRKGKQ